MRLFKLSLLLMLVGSLVPTAMVGWLSLSDTQEWLRRDVQELSQERVKQLRLRTEALLDAPMRAVVSLARSPGFAALPPDAQRLRLGALLAQERELSILTLFDAQGVRLPGLQGFAVSEVRPTEVVAHESRAQALLAAAEGGVRASPASAERPGAPTTTVLVPLGEGHEGFLAAELSLAPLVEMLAQERIGSRGVAYLVDARGHRVVAGPGLPEAGPDWSSRPVVAHLLSSAAARGRSAVVQVGHFGSDEDAVVGAYAVLPELGWAVVSEQPVGAAYRPVVTQQRRLLLGVVSAIAVAVVLAGLFARSLTRPIERFRAGALDLAAGKFGVQVDGSARNELGELARTFNYMSQQLVAYDEETRRLYASLEEGYLQTIVALANSIDSKDSYTRGHSQRVADISVEIGRELKLTEREVKLLRYGGILHDVGKIGIVDSILCKQSRLTDEEMEVMRGHPEIGDSIVEPITFLSSVRSAVRHHHERWDGSGYPDRLKGEEIPLQARIVACADTFDACTSTRPYQKAMPIETAVAILDKLSGVQLDPRVVDALKRVLVQRGVRVEGSSQPVRLAQAS